MGLLSGAASIIAILGAAIVSSKQLVIFFRTQTNQASDVRYCCTCLEALHNTLENIRSLLIKHILKTEQTSRLSSNISRFLVDVGAVETKLKILKGFTGRGGMRSAWSRLEWSFSTKT